METSHNHIQAIKNPIINENHNQQQKQVTSPSPPTSPSHEFSFTISLHSSSSHHSTYTSSTSSSSIITKSSTTKTNNNNLNSNTTSSSSFAIDLSPADDIFFHGHLLPLHLLSHLPPSSLSPRSSVNSLDSFTLPIDHLQNDIPISKTTTSSATTPASKQNKPSPFSLFNKWKKATNTNASSSSSSTTTTANQDEEFNNNKQHKRNKLRFEILKRYARMVRPFLFFRGIRKERNSLNHRRQPYSFSGTLSPRSNSYKDLMMLKRRPGDYSAPASMRTSPSNSGLLVATAGTTAASESTIDELQAAIQAAIAHCKNSIANSNDQKSTSTTTTL